MLYMSHDDDDDDDDDKSMNDEAFASPLLPIHT
jgi:hypothetical protein